MNEREKIEIVGAAENNLHNVDVTITKETNGGVGV